MQITTYSPQNPTTHSLTPLPKRILHFSSIHSHFTGDIPSSGSPPSVNTRRSSYTITYTVLPWSSLPPLPHTLPPQPISDHLSLHLYILNCQSQSNLWNILVVTVYSGRGDNISRPLWRTGTRQCVLNNINCWKRVRAGALAEEQAGETDRESTERGPSVLRWGGGNWDHVSLPQWRD